MNSFYIELLFNSEIAANDIVSKTQNVAAIQNLQDY